MTVPPPTNRTVASRIDEYGIGTVKNLWTESTLTTAVGSPKRNLPMQPCLKTSPGPSSSWASSPSSRASSSRASSSRTSSSSPRSAACGRRSSSGSAWSPQSAPFDLIVSRRPAGAKCTKQNRYSVKRTMLRALGMGVQPAHIHSKSESQRQWGAVRRTSCQTHVQWCKP